MRFGPTNKRLLWLLLGIVVILLLVYFVSDHTVMSDKVEPERHRVTYVVDGYTPASLTYRNESGGTEQRAVQLPWSLDMPNIPSGSILYLSAQNKSTGTIKARIYLDSRQLQMAESDAEYGIATVSGSIPR